MDATDMHLLLDQSRVHEVDQMVMVTVFGRIYFISFDNVILLKLNRKHKRVRRQSRLHRWFFL